MKITRLKTAVVEGNFDRTPVRIETDEGIGWLGECFFAPGLTAMLRERESVIQGEDPLGGTWWTGSPSRSPKRLFGCGTPRLGVTLNEEVARRYARGGEPFFE
jgi:hypothetical protein